MYKDGISFVIITTGDNDKSVQEVVTSIKRLQIPNHEIIVVGGFDTTLDKNDIVHIPFDESLTPTGWITRKKNIGIQAGRYNVIVVQHDYYVYDSNWYEEFVNFGTDWDICVQQTFSMPEQGSKRCNGWRTGLIPGYPEIPYCMTIPWDIDCFVPYMAIQGGFWVCKKDVMLDNPLDEDLIWGQSEDIEWSSRVVPGWEGSQQNDYKIVANPKCVTRFNKYKEPYPGDPDWDELEKSFEPLWNEIRRGERRKDVYFYDNHKIVTY